MGAQRILVIEDEPAARDALGSLLAEEGYEVCTAESGREALRRLPEFRPNIVVCDYHLPDTTGIEVLHKVRSLTQDALVFILVTAAAGGEEAERELRREVDYFFSKPLDLPRFHRVLRRAPQQLSAA